jgi:PPOX class probable F420-dependent enzyme
VNEQQARDFIARSHRGVLATIKRDGRPQLSNVAYTLDHDGRLKISVTRDRAKTANARRDPRVSLAVQGDNWYQYVVVEARAEIEAGPDVLADLRRVYELISGQPHPDWEEFDQAMIRDRRVIMALTIERLYPLQGADQ